ncbi:ras-related protein Rap-1A isoform X3 [Lutra lutra]|uniref:ras-related protein Rap-1A isoform X3 n=1 Tax=Lutra lutra TaxID=9657 RepID=UPI001FCFB230|nr:ras-related protein Rap-1A isoform X3 [Lutra lutra]
MSPVSPLAPPSSSAFPRCPGRRPGGLAGGRGRGSGRPCRRCQGQSQPRPRTEPVDCGWACGRRTGGARAECGRERGHCVPPPSQLPEVSWHKPVSLAVSSDTVPSSLTVREMLRTGHRCLFPLLACPQTRTGAGRNVACPRQEVKDRVFSGIV